MNLFTEIVAWASFVFGALIIGASLMVLYIYLKSSHMKHIVLMAFSYAILSLLTIATINWRIFYEGPTRFIGSVALLIAFVSGCTGLWLMLKAKGHEA
jgi:hypothetical protein